MDGMGSHIVLSFQNLQGESPMGSRAGQIYPEFWNGRQEFQDKVSRKRLFLAVIGVSQPDPTLVFSRDTVTAQ